ncbi:MAG: hypothetical protein IPO93_05330 [Actinobacteria bacterium]|nr:hypothetical protein [Actinomycetota bacterium]
MRLPEEAGATAQRRRFSWRWAAILFVVVAGLAVSWWGLGRILATDRGLDLSDEGLYLLGAEPPSLNAAWGFPFGWHTRPVFALVGYDIAAFRTLGALLLVLSSAWLGWAAARAVTRDTTSGARAARWFAVIAALTGATGSLLFYAPMLRTPSYNWLNLVGLTISVASALTVVSAGRARALDGRRLITAVLAGVSSAALFMTFPAKPTTLPLVLVLTAVLVLVAVGWRLAGWWVLWNVLLLPVWVGVAVLARLWPTDFLSVFRLALQMPAPDPLQTTSSAIRAAVLLPRDVAAGLAAAPDYPVLTMMAGLACLLVAVIPARRWLALRLVGFGLVGVSALAIAGAPVPVLRPAGEAFGIASAGVTTACLVILVAALLAGARLGTKDDGDDRDDSLGRWSSVALIAVLPFVFSFGSGNGIYAQASLAAGLSFVAAVAGVARRSMTRDRVVIGAAVLVAACILAGAAVGSGWRAPFRAAPLAEQTVSTLIGTHDARLLLEPALSEGITGLRDRAESVGWAAGTPLADVSYTWNPAVPYALGARVPDFLALTIFGYSAAHDIVDFHLSEPFLDFPFDRSWFLTSRESSIEDPTGHLAVDLTMQKLAAVAGRPFPDSYACVAAGDFVLWRPVSTPREAGQDCEG